MHRSVPYVLVVTVATLVSVGGLSGADSDKEHADLFW